MRFGHLCRQKANFSLITCHLLLTCHPSSDHSSCCKEQSMIHGKPFRLVDGKYRLESHAMHCMVNGHQLQLWKSTSSTFWLIPIETPVYVPCSRFFSQITIAAGSVRLFFTSIATRKSPLLKAKWNNQERHIYIGGLFTRYYEDLTTWSQHII